MQRFFYKGDLSMKKFVLLVVATSSLVLTSCGGDGCTVGSTKCDGNKVMVCQATNSTDWNDGDWQMDEECDADETCKYNEEYGVHYCD